MAAELTPEQQAFVRRCRVGRLSTVDASGEAFAVPICYGFDGTRIFTPIDEKPKHTKRPLKRVRNIMETGRATLLIDYYEDDDWSQLAWLMIRGRAFIVDQDHPLHAGSVEQLRNRYHQYREMDLETAQMIILEPDRVTSWGAIS